MPSENRKVPKASEELARMQALCAASEQCSYDIMAKLQRRGVPSGVAQRILQRLVQENFVDDRRFARAFVHDKVNFAGWGRYKIRMALAAKRLGREIIEEAMESIDPEAYHDALRRAISSKGRRMKGEERETFEGRNKLIRFAASRGFEPSLASRLLREEGEDLWREG